MVGGRFLVGCRGGIYGFGGRIGNVGRSGLVVGCCVCDGLIIGLILWGQRKRMGKRRREVGGHGGEARREREGVGQRIDEANIYGLHKV